MLGHKIKAGGDERTASRCSTSSPRIRRRRGSSRRSWRAASSATRRRRRSSIAWPHASPTTRGDLREVMRTLLTSPEFLAPDAYRAKVKTPFEFIVSAVRATGADVTDARPLVRALQELGMPLYQCQPPTGYKDTADAWVNTGALVEPDELCANHYERIAVRRRSARDRSTFEASTNARTSSAKRSNDERQRRSIDRPRGSDTTRRRSPARPRRSRALALDARFSRNSRNGDP